MKSEYLKKCIATVWAASSMERMTLVVVLVIFPLVGIFSPEMRLPYLILLALFAAVAIVLNMLNSKLITEMLALSEDQNEMIEGLMRDRAVQQEQLKKLVGIKNVIN